MSSSSSSMGWRTKIIIISSVTIVSLAVILTLIPKPNPDLCTKVDVLAMKFEQCPGGIISPPQSNVPNTINEPTTKPPDPGELSQAIIEGSTSSPLNSIDGNWLAVGNVGTQQFSASFSFDTTNQYSIIANINGLTTPTIFGKYTFSPTEKTLTLEPYGSLPEYYEILDSTSNSFTIKGTYGKTTFTRT